ncbi:hypothetical protein PRIPAC_81844 [Pristionchus pacificus]|uniref:G protein-coupled receptor n=1 Tax=Pristionchus pacificus TaxID=54126 RepID=A0A2A6CM65_PRIPA|nr:hypothetical protein PRIPAC_81844 [Pristionchus pacificus]|eukprot:PDM79190.1 G protein-coupled receptor [Pristionchus pacificus]
MHMEMDSSEVYFYRFATKFFYSIFAFLSAAGVVCNLILLFTTIRSKSLRAPCNILIGSCALFDVVHQFLPELGVAAGSFAVLSIGIDRFLSVATPHYYRQMNVPAYLSIHFLAITVFCAYNAFLIVYFYRDHDVICNMPSVFHGNAVSLWAYSSAAVNVLAFGAYVITWRLIKAKSEILEVDKMNRIFRTIVLVTIFDLSGWAITQTLVATQNFFDLADNKRLCYVCFASIFVNLGIAVKFLVYYFTSTEYKNAVKRRFNVKDYKIRQSGLYQPSISKM